MPNLLAHATREVSQNRMIQALLWYAPEGDEKKNVEEFVRRAQEVFAAVAPTEAAS